MTYDEVLIFFGNKYRLAKVCGFAACTPYAWEIRGFIPMVSQLKIQEITAGILTADYGHVRHK